ncbi:hypothetical protein ACJ41O_011858 [Fusarium nematophilum]
MLRRSSGQSGTIGHPLHRDVGRRVNPVGFLTLPTSSQASTLVSTLSLNQSIAMSPEPGDREADERGDERDGEKRGQEIVVGGTDASEPPPKKARRGRYISRAWYVKSATASYASPLIHPVTASLANRERSRFVYPLSRLQSMVDAKCVKCDAGDPCAQCIAKKRTCVSSRRPPEQQVQHYAETEAASSFTGSVDRSKIIITSRRRVSQIFWQDARVRFIALDFLKPVDELIEAMKPLCHDVTHAFFASYVHDADFSKLINRNVPLFTNFLTAVDVVAAGTLQRVCLHTGGKIPEQLEWDALGEDEQMASNFEMGEWAKDKKHVWEQVIAKYGGCAEAFDWGTWQFVDWALGKAWSTLSSVSKARKFGWKRSDDTYDTYVETLHAFENAGILPLCGAENGIRPRERPANLAQNPRDAALVRRGKMKAIQRAKGETPSKNGIVENGAQNGIGWDSVERDGVETNGVELNGNEQSVPEVPV